MKGVHISVDIGHYKGGSMTLGPRGVRMEVEVAEGDRSEIKEVVKTAVEEALSARQ